MTEEQAERVLEDIDIYRIAADSKGLAIHISVSWGRGEGLMTKVHRLSWEEVVGHLFSQRVELKK